MKTIFTLLLVFPLMTNAQNTWLQKNNFIGASRAYAVCFAINNKGYIGTGGSQGISYNDFWEYSPETDSWTQKADFGGAPRIFAFGFAISGKGYLGTGSDSIGSSVVYKDFWEYNPLTNSWAQKNDFAEFKGKDGYAVSLIIGTKAFVGTGNNETGAPTIDFWEYDDVNDSWIQKANLPKSTCGAVGFSIDSKGYIGTGWQTDTSSTTIFWEYDPIINSWTQIANMPTYKRWFSSSFSVGGKGYVSTGTAMGGFYMLNDFWEYKPLANTWAQLDSFPGAARNGAISFVIGNSAFVGLGTTSYFVKAGDFFNDFWEFNPYPAGEKLILNKEDIVSIFPTPTQSNISVSAKIGDEIKVIDATGRVIKTIENFHNTINFSTDELDNGIYFLSLYNKRQLLGSGKFVVAR